MASKGVLPIPFFCCHISMYLRSFEGTLIFGFEASSSETVGIERPSLGVMVNTSSDR